MQVFARCSDHFVKKGFIDRDLARFYTEIFDKKQTSDYHDFIEFSRDEVVSLIPSAEQLIEEIEKLIVD